MPGYVTLTNRETGQPELVEADRVPELVASQKYVDPGAVAVERNGMARYTTPDVAAREQTFAPVVDPVQAAREAGHALRERENTGALATAKAVVGGASEALSFGALSPFEEAREFNPIASGVGVAAGAIAPAFVGDVGGLFGLGREAALGEDALTAERAASGLSSKAMYAGETAAGTAERDLVRASSRIGQSADAASAQRVITPMAEQAARPALEDLDLAGLKAERQSEIEAIRAAQTPEREQFVRDLQTAHRAREADKDWLAIVADRNEEKYVRESAKVMFNADKRFRNLLDNRVGLAQRPERALEWLQQEQQAIEALSEAGERQFADYTARAAQAPQAVREELLANKVPGYRADALSARGIDAAVEKIVAERFPRSADGMLSLPRELEGFGDLRLQSALAENARLQERIARLATEPVSERLQRIDSMIAERAAPHEASFGERAVHAIAPYLGPVGAIAEKAYGGIRKLVAGASKRAAGAASSFVDTAAKVAPRVPMVATRALAAAAFAPAAAVMARPEQTSKTAKPDLAALYQKHAAEVRSQTAYNAAGVPEMRQAARLALGSQLDALRLKSPILADRIETVLAKRLEYISSILPRQPDIAGGQVGPSSWQPSDMQMRSHARSVAAVEDPHAVLERAVHGSVTPEDLAALRAVYPEILADFTNTVATQLPTLRKTLPYARRFALSMLTGVPVDPAMHPGVLRILQSQFTNDEGAPQTQAPAAQPQFASISKPDPTPAQRRAEGMHA